jgi:hypothetical protein
MTQDQKILLVHNINDLKADSQKIGNYLVFNEAEVHSARIEEIRLLNDIIQRAETIKELLTQ